MSLMTCYFHPAPHPTHLLLPPCPPTQLTCAFVFRMLRTQEAKILAVFTCPTSQLCLHPLGAALPSESFKYAAHSPASGGHSRAYFLILIHQQLWIYIYIYTHIYIHANEFIWDPPKCLFLTHFKIKSSFEAPPPKKRLVPQNGVYGEHFKGSFEAPPRLHLRPPKT